MVRRRFFAQQVRNVTPIVFLVFFGSFVMHSSGVQPIEALLIIGGSVPLWLVVGFLGARRIGRKCDSSGVYRPNIWDIRVIVSVVIGITSIFVALVVITILYPAISFSVITEAQFTFVGGGFAAPLGTILFERRTKSRLWILGTPSLMWPSSIEYHIEWAGRPHVAPGA